MPPTRGNKPIAIPNEAQFCNQQSNQRTHLKHKSHQITPNYLYSKLSTSFSYSECDRIFPSSLTAGLYCLLCSTFLPAAKLASLFLLQHGKQEQGIHFPDIHISLRFCPPSLLKLWSSCLPHLQFLLHFLALLSSIAIIFHR